MPLTNGSALGPYIVEAPLGAGGMGEVYRARDTRLNRTVAIKVLSARLTEDASFRKRFEREARAIAALEHPNICPLYDVGDQDGTSFLVMQHLQGETLASHLHRGPLPLDRALSVRGRDGTSPRRGAPRWRGASRPQAGQRHDHQEWRQAPRFRTGESGRR